MTDGTDGPEAGPDPRAAERLAAQREAAAGWDRVGRALQNTSDVAGRASKRNLDLWGTVSDHLKRDTYTADDIATDMLRAASVAMQNMTDAWSTLTRPPEPQQVAAIVPTVLIVFDQQTDELPGVEPSLLRWPPLERDDWPDTAEIQLHGGPPDDVKAVANALSARRSSEAPNAYILEGQGGIRLPVGNYGGFVYLTSPTLLLADLKIVVIGPAQGAADAPGR